MSLQAKRAIASVLALVITGLDGGPVWAQTARVVVEAPSGTAGVPALPQTALSAPGLSNFSPSLAPSLTALAPLPAPSIAGRPAPLQLPAALLTPAPVSAAAAKTTAPIKIEPVPAALAVSDPAKKNDVGRLTQVAQGLAETKPDDVGKTSALLERLYSESSSNEASAAATDFGPSSSGSPLNPHSSAAAIDEHIARYAHIPSPKKSDPFVAVGAVGLVTALATAVMAKLSFSPHAGWVEATGVIGSAILIGFPLVHVVEIYREMKALKRGGEEAETAKALLGGVSGDLHIMLQAGKLLKYPGIYASGNSTLMVNTISRVFLSSVVLAMLAKTRNLAKAKFAVATAFGIALIAAAPLLAGSHAVVTALGVLGAVIYAMFTIPQYRLNHLALLKLRSEDRSLARRSFEKLRGNSALFLALIIIGKILIIPTYIATGLVYNASSNFFSGLVTFLILLQMSRIGLLPWQKKKSRPLVHPEAVAPISARAPAPDLDAEPPQHP